MTEPTTPNFVKWQRDNFSNIDEPFAGDHWGREQFAKHLTGYVQRMKVGATIAIDAEWGAGKTWFVQHWRQHLINEGHAVAYIDAFANDYIDDPFLLIATEIANQVEKKEGKRLRKTAVSVYHAMLPSLPKLIFSAAMTLMGAGLVAQSITETVEGIKEATGDFGEKFAEDMNERIKAQLEEKVQNHEADKQTLENFKNQLTEAASKLDKPLIFIIDELDRCKPEFSIRLIERIKHFFEIPNIVFVLAIHKKQLCESIDSYYGFKSENQYLDKFIDFSFLLSNTQDQSESYKKTIQNNLESLGLMETFVPIFDILKMSEFLCKITNPTPRQIKSIFNKFSLLCFLRYENLAKQQILLICLFLKEAGKEDQIIDFKFSDEFIGKIIDINHILPADFSHRKFNYILKESLGHNGVSGLSKKLSDFLVCFSQKTIFSNNQEKTDLKLIAAKSLSPSTENNSTTEYGRDWLDYIQRGMI